MTAQSTLAIPTRWRIPARYDAAHLVAAIRHAKSHPRGTYTPRTWTASEMSAAEYLAWFRARLHEKITALGARQPTNLQGRSARGRNPHGGRKLEREYTWGLYRDAQRLRGYLGFGRRLETPEVRRRLRADHVHVYGCGKAVVCAAESERECR